MGPLTALPILVKQQLLRFTKITILQDISWATWSCKQFFFSSLCYSCWSTNKRCLASQNQVVRQSNIWYKFTCLIKYTILVHSYRQFLLSNHARTLTYSQILSQSCLIRCGFVTTFERFSFGHPTYGVCMPVLLQPSELNLLYSFQILFPLDESRVIYLLLLISACARAKKHCACR